MDDASAGCVDMGESSRSEIRFVCTLDLVKLIRSGEAKK